MAEGIVNGEQENEGRGSLWCALGLGLWSVGVQVNEGIAVAGLVLSTLGILLPHPALGHLAEKTTVCAPFSARWGLREGGFPPEWITLAAFCLWAIGAPLLFGRPPTGTGLARLGDLLGIPVASAAWRRLSPRAERSVLASCAVTLALSCTLAALQHFGTLPRDLYAPLRALKFPVDRVFEPISGAPGRFMSGGLLFHRLKFAHVTSLAALVFAGVGLRQKGPARWTCLGLSAVATASVLFFPFARSATVALLASLVLLILMWTPHKKWAAGVLLVACAGAAAGVWLDKPLRERFLSARTEEGSGGRSYLQAAGRRAIAAHPWTGLGLGRFRVGEWASEDAPPAVRSHGGKAHSQIVSVAAEVGLPGALLFLVFLFSLGTRLWRQRAPAPFGVPALAFFILLSATHDPLFHPEFGLALSLALGSVLALNTST